jgi:hypothetical protein
MPLHPFLDSPGFQIFLRKHFSKACSGRGSKGHTMQRADGREKWGIEISVSQNLVFVLAGLRNESGTGGVTA